MCAAAALVFAPLCVHAGRCERHRPPQLGRNRGSARQGGVLVCESRLLTGLDGRAAPLRWGTSERAGREDSLSAPPTGLEVRAQARTYRRCSPSPV